LANKSLKTLKKSAMLHDLGEINLPCTILNKNTRLSDSEYLLIKQHPQLAYDMLKEVGFNEKIKKIILQNHERLDGSGYPNGLKDKEILLEAKIIGAADTVVAMLSKRPYRDAFTIEKMIEEIEQYKNIKYDEKIIDIIIQIFSESENEFNLK